MKTIELLGRVDEKHRLSAEVPADIPPGLVKVAMIVSSGPEDDGGASWASGIAMQRADELADPREDIYTLDDGDPTDATR